MEVTLRVIINNDDIRKLVLQERPSTLDGLLSQLQEKRKLDYDFKLQYEDKDFNALCNLHTINDLPQNKATLKIIPLVCLTLATVSSPTPPSICSESSSTDTLILSSPTSSSSGSSMREKVWPDFFDIPNFSIDVAYRLRQGDLQYLKDGTRMSLTWDLKHNILERLTEEIYTFKAYPEDEHFESVARALISKHPCLTEPSPPGWLNWKTKLKFRMSYQRRKLREVGFEDVTINGGRKSKTNPEGEASSKNLKRPRRGEANFLPNLPDGEYLQSMEIARLSIVREMSKRNHDRILITTLMEQTFSYRRQEIIKTEPPVKDLLERWPALFTGRQVYSEFARITSKNIEMEFFGAMDQHSARLMEMFQTKKGVVGQKLSTMLQRENLANDITEQRRVIIDGLAVILGDDPSEFFKTSSKALMDETTAALVMGVLTVEDEDFQLHPSSAERSKMIAIVIEGDIVLNNLSDVPQAFCLVFALTYALHLDYPKSLRNTFRCVQSVMLGLGKQTLPPKLLSLKNYLLA